MCVHLLHMKRVWIAVLTGWPSPTQRGVNIFLNSLKLLCPISPSAHRHQPYEECWPKVNIAYGKKASMKVLSSTIMKTSDGPGGWEKSGLLNLEAD